MPLAIELAAGWVATLPCAVIAEEIERGLSLLATDLRNVPERHRSMRAVFDHSWHRLGEEERAVLRWLAVCRGGFRREAAAAVAGARLPALAALVAASLLRYEPEGRYRLHELVRQYALEHLRSVSDEMDRTQERHAAFFMAFLDEQGGRLAAGEQRAALAEIGVELDNVRDAWHRTLERTGVAVTPVGIVALAGFYHLQGRYREGIELLEPAVRHLRAAPATEALQRAVAAALNEVGQLYTRMGRVADARRALEDAHALYEILEPPLPAGPATDPRIGLGVLALIAGDHAPAARLGDAVRRRAEREEHAGNFPYGWYLTAQAALMRGELSTAGEAAETAHAAALRSRDDWFRAYCLNDLGTVAAARGDYAAAKEHIRAGYALREAFGDPEGMAVALVHLGRIAVREENRDEARDLFERALAIYRDIGDRGGQAAAIHGLGRAALDCGDESPAARHLAGALAMSDAIGLIPRTLAVVADAAELLLRAGGPERAVEALTLVADHPATDRVAGDQARLLLGDGKRILTPHRFVSATERGRSGDLDALIARLQTDLGDLSEHPAPALARPGSSLVEPLTERELTVLRLIAAGRSNREIAGELFLAVSTVKWYAGTILGKLQARNRTQAVARAREIEG